MRKHQVNARNFSEESENRIHSDEIAKKFGFRGALVPGVAVYGHMTYPLVQAFGERWLARSSGNLRLLKPAYHNDRLEIGCQEEKGQFQVTCTNEHGELLAVLNNNLTDLPEIGNTLTLEGHYKTPGRPEISWQNLTLQQPFLPWAFTFSKKENDRFVSRVDDPLPIYCDVVHPHLLLSLANTALINEYVMPTWIHVGSETRHRQLLKVGDTILIKSVPLEKWKNKGHEFVRLWITYWRDDELTTDILHTAIYKVAR